MPYPKGQITHRKLGYGGTKEEMERLIADANEWGAANGRASDLSIESFSDVVTAIQQIQEKQQIAGTTAREAGTTIEGSVNAAKAAWANLLAEFGKDDADIGARINEVVTSIFGDGTEENPGVIGNIAPRVVKIAEAIIDAIPLIMETAGPAFQQIVDKFNAFVDEHKEEIDAMAQGLWNGIVAALGMVAKGTLSALGALLAEAIKTFPVWAPELLKAAVLLFVNILQGIINVTVDVLNGLADLIGQGLEVVIGYAGDFLSAGSELIGNLADGIGEMAGNVADTAGGLISGAVDAVTGFFGGMYDAGSSIIGGLVDGIGSGISWVTGAASNLITSAVNTVSNFFWDMYKAGVNIVDGLVDGIANNIWAVADTITGGVQDAVDNVLSFLGIASPSKLFKWMGDMTMEGMAEGIENTASEAEKAMRKAADSIYGAASGEVDVNGSMSPGGALVIPQVSISIQNMNVRDDGDIERIAERLGTYIDRQIGGSAWKSASLSAV